jgi:hypothetical protein
MRGFIDGEGSVEMGIGFWTARFGFDRGLKHQLS